MPKVGGNRLVLGPKLTLLKFSENCSLDFFEFVPDD